MSATRLKPSTRSSIRFSTEMASTKCSHRCSTESAALFASGARVLPPSERSCRQVLRGRAPRPGGRRAEPSDQRRQGFVCWVAGEARLAALTISNRDGKQETETTPTQVTVGTEGHVRRIGGRDASNEFRKATNKDKNETGGTPPASQSSLTKHAATHWCPLCLRKRPLPARGRRAPRILRSRD